MINHADDCIRSELLEKVQYLIGFKEGIESGLLNVTDSKLNGLDTSKIKSGIGSIGEYLGIGWYESMDHLSLNGLCDYYMLATINTLYDEEVDGYTQCDQEDLVFIDIEYINSLLNKYDLLQYGSAEEEGVSEECVIGYILEFKPLYLKEFIDLATESDFNKIESFIDEWNTYCDYICNSTYIPFRSSITIRDYGILVKLTDDDLIEEFLRLLGRIYKYMYKRLMEEGVINENPYRH